MEFPACNNERAKTAACFAHTPLFGISPRQVKQRSGSVESTSHWNERPRNGLGAAPGGGQALGPNKSSPLSGCAAPDFRPRESKPFACGADPAVRLSQR